MDTLRISTAQNVELSFATAGLGERIVAWMIDIAIVTAYVFAVFVAPDLVGLNLGSTASTILMLPVLFYHLLFEVLMGGQTPGKRMRRLRVARLDGAPPTFVQYALRWLLRWVDVTLSSGGVAVLAIAFTRHGQRLGDLAAGTTVLRALPAIDLVDVRYPVVPDGYRPRTPADRLSDADIRTIRAVLLRFHGDPRSAAARDLVSRAHQAVAARLDLPPSSLRAEDVLNRVVTDYTAIHDRYA